MLTTRISGVMERHAIFNGESDSFALGHEVRPLQLARRQQSIRQHPTLVQLEGPYSHTYIHTYIRRIPYTIRPSNVYTNLRLVFHTPEGRSICIWRTRWKRICPPTSPRCSPRTTCSVESGPAGNRCRNAPRSTET